VERVAQGWAGEERTRTFGLIQAAPYEYQKASSKRAVGDELTTIFKKHQASLEDI
jgi:hypothetical protein